MCLRPLAIAGCLAAAMVVTISYAAASSKEVALIIGVKGSPFCDAMVCGAKDAATKLGLKLTVSAPDQFAADSQIPIVSAVTASRPAVAIVEPADVQALILPLREMAGFGTKVLTVDTTVNDTSFVETQIVTDNKLGGRMAADELNKLLNGKGKVITITQPPGAAAQDARIQGFEEEIKKYPGIEYLGPQYQRDDPQKAAEIITSMLSAHPDLGGVFATNDQGTIGAVNGLRQAQATGRVKVVAFDAATAEVNALKNGVVSVLIAQNPKMEGEIAMQLAAKLLQGDQVEKTTLTPIMIIRTGEIEKADQYEYKADCSQ
jgi:ribose transport system substrate-binding protein